MIHQTLYSEAFINTFGDSDKEFSYLIAEKELEIVVFYPESPNDPYGTVFFTIGLSNHLKNKENWGRAFFTCPSSTQN